MYCDLRLGGIEQWYAHAPEDATMRIPDEMLDCTCFLCIKDGDIVKPWGTAFLVWVPVGNFLFYYLVTAKHCVTKAFEKYGALYARINTSAGSTDLVKLDGTWACSDEGGVDVAVLPWFPDSKRHVFGSIDIRTGAFEGNLKANGIGIGNELIVVGLFHLHYGTEKNIPIVRHGIIASMPGEPLKDMNTELLFKAYLAEIQSIGGLSGSPVFAFVPAMQLLAHHDNIKERDAMRKRWPAGFLYLLGLIRGHFDAPQDGWVENSQERVHTGIAIVVPIDEVLSIVQNDKALAEARTQRMLEHQQKQANAQVDDVVASEESEQPFTQVDFENALRKVSRRLPS
jgi:hypothetical protein